MQDHPPEGAQTTYSLDDPRSIEAMAQVFGHENVQLLLGLQARYAADAPRLQSKVREIEADPNHPERAALGCYRMRARGAQQHHASHRRLKMTLRAGKQSNTSHAIVRTPHRAGRSKIHGAAQRASARSGDSGSEDPDDDPEDSPPPSEGRRFCACGCGWSIDHLKANARYFNGTHRVRGHRNGSAPVSAADSYYDLPTWELSALQQRVVDGCRCNGSHVIAADEDTCLRCGHEYRDIGHRHVRPVAVAPYYRIIWDAEVVA